MKQNRISRRQFLLAVGAMCLLTGCQMTENERTQQGGALPALRIGVDILKPFCYVDTNGDYAGIDADIATEACRRAGYQPVFTELPWAERDHYLEDGEVDCLWTAFIIDGREEQYLWTDSYMESDLRLMVDMRSPSQSLDDFRGPGGIAVRAGSRSEELLLGRKNAEGEAVKVHAYGSYVMAQTAFVKAYVDMLAGHELALRQVMTERPDTYKYLAAPLSTSHLGVGFQKDSDPAARDALNTALHAMQQDGALSAILQRYESDASSAKEAAV